MSKRILEVWVKPERAIYIEIEKEEYNDDWLLDAVNSASTYSFSVESVDGKVYIFPTSSVHFMVLHPIDANHATF